MSLRNNNKKRHVCAYVVFEEDVRVGEEAVEQINDLAQYRRISDVELYLVDEWGGRMKRNKGGGVRNDFTSHHTSHISHITSHFSQPTYHITSHHITYHITSRITSRLSCHLLSDK